MDNRGARNHKRVITLLLVALLLLSCEFLSSEPSPDSSQSDTEDNAVTIPTATGFIEAQPVPPGATAGANQFNAQGDNSTPPADTAKLIFIHHSVGENWLADDDGGLGLALRDNNYFVSDTNYGWGPNSIGDRTDIGDWIEWFVGADSSDNYLPALYTSYENYTGNYNRLDDPDSGRENEIILFKSCYPNSNLDGSPDDPPAPGDPYSVGGAKQTYVELLSYFETQPDKLFVIITAPPVTEGDSTSPPENSRAFNNWLITDWLANYGRNNVAVFDFYNVLTSNGGNIIQNDLGQEEGNHHRWWHGAVQHSQTEANDLSAYGSDDSHPNQAGNRKATGEFVPLLNVFYNRWQNNIRSQSSKPDSNSEATSVNPIVDRTHPASPTGLIQPEDLGYMGAFRLPDGPPEIGWAWGGAALALCFHTK